jgi:adenylate cyclase
MSVFWPRQTQAHKPRNSATGAAVGLPRRSYAWAVAAPIAALLLVLEFPVRADLSDLIFDWYQRLAPRQWDPKAPVRVVDIDNESLARVGQWPWPRSTIANLVTRLGELGATVVVTDIVFAESDAQDPARLIPLLPAVPARSALEAEIGKEATNDEKLAAAIGATPTVLGAILTNDERPVAYPAKYGIATAGDDPKTLLPSFSSAVVPLPALATAASGLGALNWLPDRDQVVRRVPLVLTLREQIVTGLAVEALRVAQGASTVIVRSSNASGQSAFGAHSGVNTIKVGDLEIPTDPRGEVRIRYSTSERGRRIPAWKVLRGDVDAQDIQNRIILIGTSAAGVGDLHATPVDPAMPGTEIQAQFIEQLLTESALARPDWLRGAELTLTMALVLGLATLLRRTNALTGATVAAVGFAGACATSWYAFSARGLLVDPTLPAIGIALTYISCVGWLYWDEQLQRRYVREAFGRYVSPAVVARLAEQPDRLALGGETRTLTVLFSDIRGFTGIAETLDAQQLTQFINEYLTPMTEIVLDHGGTLDKYIGDGLVAFWNAPLEDPTHAAHAARAALAMRRALDTLNQRRQAHASASGKSHNDIKFGVGLATGECCVGNFGSIRRFDYSALGDSVNLAARLEGATKFYRTDILASETTRDRSTDLAWLEVDRVRLPGKSEVVRIFTLAGDEVAPHDLAVLTKLHDEMLSAYRLGKFAEAAASAASAGDLWPYRRDFYLAYEERCRELTLHCPDEWVAVTKLTSK